MSSIQGGVWPPGCPQLIFFFRKWSGSSETQNKHIKFFSIYEGGLACLRDQKMMFSIYSLFNWEKNKLSLKSWSWLTDAKSAIKKILLKKKIPQ